MVQVEDLLGIPYKKDGVDKRGFDCKGLVLFILNRIGCNISDFNIESKMVKTKTLREGDVILFYDIHGRVCHTGLYLGEGCYIQSNYLGVNIANLKNCKKYWEAFTWQQ